jgi:hypothetical protein
MENRIMPCGLIPAPVISLQDVKSRAGLLRMEQPVQVPAQPVALDLKGIMDVMQMIIVEPMEGPAVAELKQLLAQEAVVAMPAEAEAQAEPVDRVQVILKAADRLVQPAVMEVQVAVQVEQVVQVLEELQDSHVTTETQVEPVQTAQPEVTARL